jgi:hypothetical protein
VLARPKSIQYFNKNKETRESAQVYIDLSRQILVTKISINDKKDETERLLEYINAES